MSQIMDPETKPSPAAEVVHRGKGCLAVLVALAVLVGGGYFVWDRASSFISAQFGDTPDYPGPGKTNVTVDVPAGSSVDDVGMILHDDKVILSTKAWDEAVAAQSSTVSIQAGRYRLKTELPAKDALAILLDPDQSRIRSQVTIPEGLRLSAQVAALVKGTKITKSAYLAALKKPASYGLPAAAGGKAEGYLFPNTYELTPDSTATSVLKQMTAQFKATSKELDLDARAKKLGISTDDLVIVASIIEKEVRRPDDRAKVARVLYNRLDDDKDLQLNSTLVYALNYKSEGQITTADLKKDIPYNTYVRSGLPPTPIAAPGKAALEAAANPVDGDWLYFVTINCDSGETVFTHSGSQHKRNVARFQAWRDAHPGRC
ncbi:MAG: endolytic transglycosylase MltG [Propionibacteriaceae bacterium]